MKITEVAQRGYEAFVLDNQTRNELAKRFPPKYPDWIGHHITNLFNVPYEPSIRPYGETHLFEVVGYVDDGEGLEALIVSRKPDPSHYHGPGYRRPDGKVYHITWSLDRSKGRKPVQSNDLIAKGNWQPTDSYKFEAPLQFLKMNQG